MEPLIGTVTLWTALLLAAGSVILSVISIAKNSAFFRKLSFYCEAGCFALLSIAFLLLVYAFLTTDLGLHNVWLLTDKGLETQYKISAIWSGMDGSIFVWGYLILAAILANDIITKVKEAARGNGEEGPEKKADGGKNKDQERGGKRNSDIRQQNTESTAGDGRRTADLTRLVAMAAFALFMVMILVNDPFAPTHSYTQTYPDGWTQTIYPSDFPDGVGLKPELKNPWMMIHPPLIFLAYSAILVCFGASIASFFTKDDRWLKVTLPWSRFAWLLLTIGIGIGAIWAYTVIRWGGYWSWDPKETSAFIVWISLSAFIFMQHQYHKGVFFRKAAPVLGIATFVLMLFGTFITRSGLWSSVPLGMKSGSSYFFVAVILGVLALGLYLIIRANKASKDEETENGAGGKGEMVGKGGPAVKDGTNGKVKSAGKYETVGRGGKTGKSRRQMDDGDGNANKEERKGSDGPDGQGTVEKTLLIISAFIAFMLTGILLRSMDAQFSNSYFEVMLFPALMALLIMLCVFFLKGLISNKALGFAVAGTLAAGVIMAFLLPLIFPGSSDALFYFITKQNALAFMAPILAFVVGSAAYSAWRHFDRLSIRPSLLAITSRLAVIGIALILFGYGAGAVWSEDSSKVVDIKDKVTMLGTEMSFKNGHYENDGTYMVFTLDVEVKEGGSTDAGTLKWEYYLDRDDVVPTPVIIHGASQDVYISVSDIDPDQNGTIDYITLEVKRITLINLVWCGYGLMILAMLARIGLETSSSSDKTQEPDVAAKCKTGNRPQKAHERPRMARDKKRKGARAR